MRRAFVCISRVLGTAPKSVLGRAKLAEKEDRAPNAVMKGSTVSIPNEYPRLSSPIKAGTFLVLATE